jgi:carboxylate-amine ligase
LVEAGRAVVLIPTIGVEEEFLLADGSRGQQAATAAETLAVAGRTDDGFSTEFRVAMVETASGICPDLATVAAKLRRRRRVLAEAAEELHCRVLASGTHPTADPRTVAFTPGARYDRIAALMGPLADQAPTSWTPSRPTRPTAVTRSSSKSTPI